LQPPLDLGVRNRWKALLDGAPTAIELGCGFVIARTWHKLGDQAGKGDATLGRAPLKFSRGRNIDFNRFRPLSHDA
jgi:hypothetical protein